MKKKVRVQVADPAGNTTIYVLDRFPQSEYGEVGKQLLANEALDAEQVGFITGPRTMEMSGLEFCGNATRAFAYLMAKTEGATEPLDMTVRVSGTDGPLVVKVDPANDYSGTEMPLPVAIYSVPDIPVPEMREGILVDLGGIMHLVVVDVEASQERFDAARAYIAEKYDPAAIGVMFLTNVNTDDLRMTPIVYVRDVDSVYWEGSCASGTAAAAVAMAYGQEDGVYGGTLRQPGGELTAAATVENGRYVGLRIEGSVTCGPVQEVEIDI